MKKNNLGKIVFVGALIGCMTVGAISAYFTDADTATNTFTVGKVSIDLQEPDWVPPTDITPEEEFAKDPKIVNDGINDAYVFVEVVVPYANVVTANEDGTKNAAADTELFSYDLKEGWIEVGTPAKDEETKTVTHLYAYSSADTMTVLAKDAETPAVFDFIKFANIVEDQELEATTLEVVVNAYAIQTKNIIDGKDALDGNNADGVAAPDAVWAVLSAQAPSAAVEVTEEENTDIKQ